MTERGSPIFMQELDTRRLFRRGDGSDGGVVGSDPNPRNIQLEDKVEEAKALTFQQSTSRTPA
jgi:hypothetical protein